MCDQVWMTKVHFTFKTARVLVTMTWKYFKKMSLYTILKCHIWRTTHLVSIIFLTFLIYRIGFIIIMSCFHKGNNIYIPGKWDVIGMHNHICTLLQLYTLCLCLNFLGLIFKHSNADDLNAINKVSMLTLNGNLI